MPARGQGSTVTWVTEERLCSLRGLGSLQGRREHCSKRQNHGEWGVLSSEVSRPCFQPQEDGLPPCLNSPPPPDRGSEPAWAPGGSQHSALPRHRGEERGGTYSPSPTLSRGYPAHRRGRSHRPRSPRGPQASQSSRCASAEPGEGRVGHRAQHLTPAAWTGPEGQQTRSQAK